MGRTRGGTILHARASETTTQTHPLPDEASSTVAGKVSEESIRISFDVTENDGGADSRYRVLYQESWDRAGLAGFRTKEVLFAGNIIKHWAKTVHRTGPRGQIVVELLGTAPDITYDLRENREG